MQLVGRLVVFGLYVLVVLVLLDRIGIVDVHWPWTTRHTDPPKPPPPPPPSIPAPPPAEMTCIVPNIEGLDETAAKRAISSLGLKIAKSNRYDSKVPQGAVLSQEPAAGTKLRPCQGEVTMVISLGQTPPPPPAVNVEPDIDRPGRDYKNFDLSEARPELCRMACANETQCKAYTYAKPGVQGPNARCWLKSDVPNPVRNQCCVSGLKVAPMPPLSPAANPIGCFRDQGASAGTSGRDLNGFFMDSSSMTTATCINECRQRGFAYAGTQYGHQCFCGNSYGQHGPSNDCKMPCSGSPAEICGGYWANRVYGVSR